jgi:hypothetical protein
MGRGYSPGLRPVPSSAVLGFLVSGVVFGGVLILVVGVSGVNFVFAVVSVVVGPREVRGR